MQHKFPWTENPSETSRRALDLNPFCSLCSPTRIFCYSTDFILLRITLLSVFLLISIPICNFLRINFVYRYLYIAPPSSQNSINILPLCNSLQINEGKSSDTDANLNIFQVLDLVNVSVKGELKRPMFT